MSEESVDGTVEPAVEIIRLESLDELDFLVRGDVISLIYRFKGGYQDMGEIGAFHDKTNDGLYQFLIACGSATDNYILRRQAFKNKMATEDGTIVLIEDGVHTETYLPTKPNPELYAELNQTLIDAGLR